MTEKEILESRIKILEQYLQVLISDVEEAKLGLPKNVTRQDEIDKTLDLLKVLFKKRLK